VEQKVAIVDESSLNEFRFWTNIESAPDGVS